MQDYFGKETNLSRKKLWLFDMDGTIYEEKTLFDGTLDLLNAIHRQRGKYVFITNNSSRSVTDYVRKVNGLGITAKEDNFFTSAQATILWLKKSYPGAKVYCEGTRSFVKELEEAGIDITEQVEQIGRAHV